MQVRETSGVERFVRGAIIVSLAGLGIRILGAIYRPIVARLFAPFDGHMGDAGLGLAQIPTPAYAVVMALSAIGTSVAVSKLVSERLARGSPAAANRVFRVAFALMATIGLALGLLMYTMADVLATAAGRPETAPGFRATAPAIFLVSMQGALRGLFQGRQDMTPFAISQIWEQLFRVCSGTVLVYWFASASVPLAAAGYNFGFAVGALAGLVYLLIAYQGRGRPTGQTMETDQEAPEPVRTIIWQILVLAIPIALVGGVDALVPLVDSMLVLNRLAVAGVSTGPADSLLGQIGNSYALIMPPTILTSSMYVSLIPAIAESMARADLTQARRRAAIAYRLTLLVGIPATVGIWVLSEQLYNLFFLGDGGPVLAAMSLATLFLMLHQTSSGILQGMGKTVVPARNFVVAVSVKVGLTYWWTAIPAMGAIGTAYATAAAFAISAGLNLLVVHRHMGKLVGIVQSWLKPAVAAAAMGVFVGTVHPLLARATAAPNIATLVVALVGALVYGVSLVLMRGVHASDLRSIPRWGPAIERWLRRWRLMPHSPD